MENKGAVNALLDIYKNAILDFKTCIATIKNEDLIKTIDFQTTDDNCKSIQNIIAHVVNSGFSYATSIYNSKGNNQEKPPKKFHIDIALYHQDLDEMFSFTDFVFEQIQDNDLEECNDLNKIKTGWQQSYDIEQLMEHAIVHILRHQRQINTLKKRLN